MALYSKGLGISHDLERYISGMESISYLVDVDEIESAENRGAKAGSMLMRRIRLIEVALLLDSGAFSGLDDRKLQSVQFIVYGLEVIPERCIGRLGALRTAGLDVRAEGKDGRMLLRMQKRCSMNMLSTSDTGMNFHTYTRVDIAASH